MLAIITGMIGEKKKHPYFVPSVVSDEVQPTMPLRWHLRCIVAGFISILDPPMSSCKRINMPLLELLVILVCKSEVHELILTIIGYTRFKLSSQ